MKTLNFFVHPRARFVRISIALSAMTVLIHPEMAEVLLISAGLCLIEAFINWQAAKIAALKEGSDG